MNIIKNQFSKKQILNLHFDNIKELLKLNRTKTCNYEINYINQELANIDFIYDKSNFNSFKLLNAQITKNLINENQTTIKFKFSLIYLYFNLLFSLVLCIIPFIRNEINWQMFFLIYFIFIIIIYFYFKWYMNYQIDLFIKDLRTKHEKLYG